MKSIKLACTASLLIASLGLAINGYSQSWLTNGLVAYYPFNGNANDVSGNGHNGTVSGSGIQFVVDRFGNPAHAMSFAGSGGFVTLPGLDDIVPTTTNGGMTVSFWMRTNSSGTVISKYLNLRPDSNFYVQYDKANLYMNVTGKGVNSFLPSYVFHTDWEQIVVQLFSGTGNVKIWMNGQLLGSNTLTFNSVVVSTPMVLGKVFTPDINYPRYEDGLSGTIDDIRIYNRALSSDEVAELYVVESGPRVDLLKKVQPTFSGLYLGTNYQLQISGNMSTWTNQGSPFTATNMAMVYPQEWYVDNWNSLYFRLQVSP